MQNVGQFWQRAWGSQVLSKSKSYQIKSISHIAVYSRMVVSGNLGYPQFPSTYSWHFPWNQVTIHCKIPPWLWKPPYHPMVKSPWLTLPWASGPPQGHLIGSLGERITQCGFGPCAFQKSCPPKTPMKHIILDTWWMIGDFDLYDLTDENGEVHWLSGSVLQLEVGFLITLEKPTPPIK